MSTALIILPHQLFREHPGFSLAYDECALIEDDLFFGDQIQDARFHKQKLWLHRASMKAFQQSLLAQETVCTYTEHQSEGGTFSTFVESFRKRGGTEILVADPHDYLVSRRIIRIAREHALGLRWLATPMFINRPAENRAYRETKTRWYMADFYSFQRRRLNVLMDDDKPLGGQWSFDQDNRKKVPRSLHDAVPQWPTVKHTSIDIEAQRYILARYGHNPGQLGGLLYPTTHEGAAHWLDVFLTQRFERFGPYEDAMLQGERLLWHSVLTPMLNIGLLTPGQVLDAALNAAKTESVPLNSVEGFVRQVIGWREFVRATYDDLGVAMRTTNHWDHHRPMPEMLYTGTTGIDPVDDVISGVLETGYCHHIERLMVLGGFMFLCEIKPDAVYRWFMEMFVDSYDWVMVPNVYAMSQHADGGLITTKPYFSGSAYIRKMSNYQKGDWAAVWDGLYWRWIMKHNDTLAKNPRWAMMCAMARKMDPDKRAEHLTIAEAFLARLR